jgi:5'-nucleotidase/UDP-sugar diphosphatase
MPTGMHQVRHLAILLLLLVAFCAACAPGAIEAPRPSRRKLVISHIADLHSHLFPERVTLTARDVSRGLGAVAGDTALVGGVARLATVLDAARAEADVALTLDAGDVLEGTAVYTLFGGVPEMRAVDALGVDAQALGNHDFAPGIERLAALRGYAPHTALVAANLGREGEGPGEPLSAPFAIVERGGLRVLVVGLGRSPDGAPDVAACASEVQQVIDANRDVDVTVLLSHLGSDLDRALVPKTTGIDVLLGGHTHDVTFPPPLVRDCGAALSARRRCQPRPVPVVHCGAYGRFAGRGTLVVSTGAADFGVSSTEFELIPITDAVDERPDVVELLEPYRRAMERAGLGRPIAFAPNGVSRSAAGGRDSPLGNLVANAMRWAAGAELAVINSTGIRDDLPAGELAVEDVFRVLPFEDELVTIDATGKALLAAFGEIRQASCERGRVSQAQIAGATVRFGCDGQAPELTIAGRGVDPGRTYRVATASFLTEKGRWLAPAGNARVARSGPVRDAVLVAFQAFGPCPESGALPCIDDAAGAVSDRRIEWY